MAHPGIGSLLKVCWTGKEWAVFTPRSLFHGKDLENELIDWSKTNFIRESNIQMTSVPAMYCSDTQIVAIGQINETTRSGSLKPVKFTAQWLEGPYRRDDFLPDITLGGSSLSSGQLLLLGMSSKKKSGR
jgi:hypothetical protein